MASVTIVWNREKQAVASSSGIPLVFSSTGNADTHIARLKAMDIKQGGKSATPGTYDKVTVTI